MKTRKYVVAAAFAAMLAGCAGQKQTNTIGIDLANMDTTVAAGQDFYEYACGNWMKSHPLTAEYSRYGSFEVLDENNRKQLRELIEGIASKQNEPGSLGQKIGDVYNLAMDSVTLNQQGAEPIKEELQQIAAMKDKSEIVPMITQLLNQGVGSYFSSFVYADPKNSDVNMFQLNQGGINLGEKEYYLDNDSATINIRENYKKYIVKLFTLVGCSEAEATQKMNDVMEIETAIAKESFDAVQQRDPEANYHKMAYADFKKQFAGFDWDAYVKGLGIKTEIADLNVSQLEPIKEVVRLINTLPVSKHIAYLQFNLIDAAASCLSDDFVNARFDFYGKVLSGRQELSPRWKRAVSAVDGMLGEAVGQMYVEKYFPAAAKERMVKLVKNLQTALGERIDAQDWMSDSTKLVAKEKLATFHVKVGYPDIWKDYSNLDIKKDSYWANNCRASKWALDDNYSRLGKPVDKDEWLMTPQTVNAYYNPSTNEICFPAGILQYPFFDMNADDAFNYGAIGVVIGHEMTHGFDDQGRQFDKNGNLRDWWAAGDAERFNERVKVMADFFSNIEVLPGLKANGQLTLGENIADHGGLSVSYLAFKNATKDAPLATESGLTPEQRFFLAYANVWAANVRDEEIRSRTKSDPHSLGRWRVNGALPHIDAWYEAFHITPNDPLYIAPENRVKVW